MLGPWLQLISTIINAILTQVAYVQVKVFVTVTM